MHACFSSIVLIVSLVFNTSIFSMNKISEKEELCSCQLVGLVNTKLLRGSIVWEIAFHDDIKDYYEEKLEKLPEDVKNDIHEARLLFTDKAILSKYVIGALVKNDHEKISSFVNACMKYKNTIPSFFFDIVVEAASLSCQKVDKESFKKYFDQLPEGFFKMACRCVYNVHYYEQIDTFDCLALFVQPRLQLRTLAHNVEKSTITVGLHINLLDHSLFVDEHADKIVPLLGSLCQKIFPLKNECFNGLYSIILPQDLKTDFIAKNLDTVEIVDPAATIDAMGMGMGRLELVKECSLPDNLLQPLIEEICSHSKN